jgi:hypothetical protein
MPRGVPSSPTLLGVHPVLPEARAVGPDGQLEPVARHRAADSATAHHARYKTAPNGPVARPTARRSAGERGNPTRSTRRRTRSAGHRLHHMRAGRRSCARLSDVRLVAYTRRRSGEGISPLCPPRLGPVRTHTHVVMARPLLRATSRARQASPRLHEASSSTATGATPFGGGTYLGVVHRVTLEVGAINRRLLAACRYVEPFGREPASSRRWSPGVHLAR